MPPKTSLKTFLLLVHRLNEEMDAAATMGQNLLQQIENIQYTSVTDVQTRDELTEEFETMGEGFRKLDDMKAVLMDGLRRKLIQTLDEAPMSSRTKSMTLRRSKSLRKSRRVKSI